MKAGIQWWYESGLGLVISWLKDQHSWFIVRIILHLAFLQKKKKSQPIKLGFIHAWCIFSFWVWGDKIFDSHVLLEDCNVEETCNVYYNYVSEIVLSQKHNFSLLFHWEQKSLFSSGKRPSSKLLRSVYFRALQSRRRRFIDCTLWITFHDLRLNQILRLWLVICKTDGLFTQSYEE